MSLTEWIAHQHSFFVHIPAAMAVFLPLPLLAAQRMGRGIRPWWLMCRYLSVMGFLGLVLTMISGYASVPNLSLLKSLVSVAGNPTSTVSVVYHQFFSTLSLILGVLTLLSMFRKRKDHQSLGLLALVFGLLWCAAILCSHHYGTLITGTVPEPPKKVATAPLPPVAAVPVTRKVDPEGDYLLKILDYQSLSPIHSEPVRSKAHGDRWIRVWVSPEALESYRAGTAMPNGALAVMSTVEDRWGRPSTQAGPIYAIEVRQGAPALSLYWGKVPEAQRANFGGSERIFWKDSAPQLQNCLSCHAQGLAPMAGRSRWGVPRSNPGSVASR